MPIVQVAATGAHSAAERSYSKSEVRGKSWEDPVPEGQWISGEITPERMKGWSQRKNNSQLWM